MCYGHGEDEAWRRQRKKEKMREKKGKQKEAGDDEVKRERTKDI